VSEQDGFPGSAEIVRLGDEEATVGALSQAVLGLWEVVNNLTRLRPTRRLRYRVTVFGSARTDPDHWVYAAVRDLAAELTCLGCDIVTGGGPGLMQAANEGARIAGADPDRSSVGIRVDLPFEQDVNPFVGQVLRGGDVAKKRAEMGGRKMSAVPEDADPKLVRLELSPDVHRQFRIEAAKEGLSMAALARKLVEEWTARRKAGGK
jgi:hypothetical protein